MNKIVKGEKLKVKSLLGLRSLNTHLTSYILLLTFNLVLEV
jgi:hypothetical protein